MLTKTLVVYDNSLGQVLRTVARERKDSNNLNGISLKYEVKLSEEAYRILQRHTLIKQEIQLEMIRLVQDLVRTAFATHVRGAPFDADMHTRAQAMLVTGETRVNALIDKHLQRHAEVDGAWKSYYKGQRKELIFAATGLAMSAVSMGLAVPTGGASIAVAVIAGARSLVTGFNKLKECWLTAEEYQVHLKKSIDRLTAAYREGVGVGRLQTLGGAMVNATGITPALELLPRVKGKLLANMGTIDSDMKVYRGKLGSLYAAANELAGTLFDLLDRTESLRLAYPGQQLPQLTKLEREIDELLSSGIVLTGGTSQMPGIVELAEDIFLKPVRLGAPEYDGSLADVVRSPRYATVLGLLLEAKKQYLRGHIVTRQDGSVKAVWQRMKEWIAGNF